MGRYLIPIVGLVVLGVLLWWVTLPQPSPAQQKKPQPFTAQEMDALRAILSRKECLMKVLDKMDRIEAGELRITLPPLKE